MSLEFTQTNNNGGNVSNVASFGPSRMRWTRIEDGIPASTDRVVLARTGPNHYYLGTMDEDGVNAAGRYFAVPLHDVTHWMFIDEPDAIDNPHGERA